MRRRTLDALLTTGGLVLAAILLIAGVLLTWGHVFVNNQVHDQLAAQKITMPAGDAIAEPTIKPYLSQYAGQQLTTGAQAEAYANHFIAVHLQGSAAARPTPSSRRGHGQPDRRQARRPGSDRSSRARRCAACCSTPTPSGSWASSRSTARSQPSSEPASCSC